MLSTRRTKKEIISGIENIEKSKLIANNTVEYKIKDDTNIYIRLHLTDIITKHKNGSVTLKTDGWTTPTTKSRINENIALGYIHQEKSQWYFVHKDQKYVFVDGITISKTGKVKYPKGKNPAKEVKKRKKLIKDINDYCKKIMNLDELPKPNRGDCWLCLRKNPDTDCLMSHIKESYIHGSLLMNAAINKNPDNPHFLLELDRRYIVQFVRKYLKKKLL